ncbi:POU domain transcription factor, class 6 [Paragonimus westermani]|uniref:POU domain transcription factor, class 6 n=1 Tax=Paragonimus westermani TaxID=34504 RepID=A0A5J4NM07_9TREM|nr:POU domain transcription factor, class 6 [Paragonimus westermani]
MTGMEPLRNREEWFLSNSAYLASLYNIGTIFHMNENCTSQYKAVASDTSLLFYPEHRLYTTTIPNGFGVPVADNKSQVNSTEHLSSVAAFAPVNSDPSDQSKEDQCKSRNGYSKSARLKSLFKTDEPIPNDVELNEICEFARYFKLRRLTLGLTQTQVGTALNAKEGPAYSQSAICRFEKLDVTAKSAKRMKPVLEQWLSETEATHGSNGKYFDVQLMSQTPRKRKRRTCFSPQALSQLVDQLRKNPYPSKTEMTELSQKLTYDREVIRVWFCNRRQALKMESVSLASTMSEPIKLSRSGDEKPTDSANCKSSV